MNIGEYVGHGSFVAGVLRCIAPDAQVQVEGMLTHGGAVTESDILLHLSRALDQMPDVISMSAGCTTRHNLPPVAFEVLWERRLKHYKGTVLVVAAGNNGARQPFWPAAYEWTVSVGALDRDGDRAAFSDFGSWVDLYAPGVDIVNAYPNGTYNYREPPRTGQTSEFTNGMASWSGTSFATPIVAGMIAARMSRTGQSGRLAADDILRIARGNAKPGVGAIADPAMTFDP
jgi:subtilisin family serine protease